jgi:hypothetical protein
MKALVNPSSASTFLTGTTEILPKSLPNLSLRHRRNTNNYVAFKFKIKF